MALSLSSVGQIVGKAAGYLGRGAWWGTKNIGAPMAAAGVYSGAKVGAAMGAATIGAVGKVGRAGLATGIGLTRGATWAGRKMGLGFKMHEMSVMGRTLRIPEQLNRRTQNALVFGTLGAAGLAGAASAAIGPRWDINQAIGTGAVEVERPDFLGATGSLALSMAGGNRQNAMMRQQVSQNGGLSMNSRMMVSLADDAALMMAHRLIR